METCIDELKAGMMQARQSNDVVVKLMNNVGAGIVKAFEWPEVIDWKDDGKGEVHTKYGGPDGKAVMTLKVEVASAICENCNRRVNLTTNEGHLNRCDFVWGRRGWRQLGAYDDG